MSYFSNAGVFLIQTLFGLYAIVVMVRLLLQLVRADFYNPLSQFIVKVTNPPLKPLRRLIPGLGGVDMASVVLLLILKSVEIFLISLFPNFPTPGIIGMLALAVTELLALLINVYLFSIIIQAILSWLAHAQGSYNPAAVLLHQLTEPVMRPVRRYVRPISGLDLSPLVAIIGLYLVTMLLIDPIKYQVCRIDLFNLAYCGARLL